jgi:hypothetical protein
VTLHKLARPRAPQLAATKAVVRWYLDQYFRRPSDPGVVEMFCDPARVGSFAVAFTVGGSISLCGRLVERWITERKPFTTATEYGCKRCKKVYAARNQLPLVRT